MDRAGRNEADIQAPQPEAGQQARVSGADEDARRPGCPESPSAQGARAARREGRREVISASGHRGERLPREARITRSVEIRTLLERGKRKRTKNLDVFFAASPVARSRMGVIVPKHGRRVVDRNLLKRRVREVGRREVLPHLEAAGAHVDVLIRMRRTAYELDFDLLRREVLDALETLWSQGS